MKKILAFALSVVFVLMAIGVSYSRAATIYVPGDQPTIQAGINAAVNGDTVLVADGTYTGAGNKDLYFGGKAITVKSENGPSACIIDCEGSGLGFYFDSGEGLGSVVDGFTVQNGNADYGGGIFCYSSSPSISNCMISGNSANWYGGGIFCYESSPSISNCTISGNSAYSDGGGILCNWYSSPTISNCTISGNSASYSGGGILCFWYSSPSISNCTISGNSASYGGGIFCDWSSPSITNCTISGNSANDGGISCYDYSSPSISNCTISGNSAYDSGGGIYCFYYSSPSINNCILWNDSPNEIYLYDVDSSPIVTYSDIQGGYTGEGNIDADPLFVDSANGDYHLQSGSPCIDTGTNTGAPSEDKDGVSRPQDGNNDGLSICDMGAYEYVLVPLDIMGSIYLNVSPLVNHRVILRQYGEPEQIVMTNEMGDYQIESVVSGKCFSLSIQGAIVPEPWSVISGVINLRGVPLAGRTVILSQYGEPDQVTTTDTGGFYQFISPVPGKCFRVIIRGGVVPE